MEKVIALNSICIKQNLSPKLKYPTNNCSETNTDSIA